jgi:hypothetical protein
MVAAGAPADLPAVKIDRSRSTFRPIGITSALAILELRWFNRLLEDYGGDIGSMVTLRSYLAPINKRVQNQLGLEQNLLGELLGDTVISDVALVGRDTFTRDGAAIGILFQAKNTGILKNDLSQQRKRALDRAKEQGATAETLQIAGCEVSFFSTPDSRLRSFHAIDGDFHLVTTSRAMAEQFLALKEGGGSLGKDRRLSVCPAVHAARPPGHGLRLFLVGVLRGSAQPAVPSRTGAADEVGHRHGNSAARPAGSKNRRRARRFARRPHRRGPLAARFRPPAGWQRTGDRGRPDARLAARSSGDIHAHLGCEDRRHHAGRSLQAGVPERTIGPAMAANGPLLVGIQRLPSISRGARIVIDGNIAPLDESKYGWLVSILGPPTRRMITTAEETSSRCRRPSAAAWFRRQFRRTTCSSASGRPAADGDSADGPLADAQLLRSTPGCGSYPRAGLLDLLPLNLGGSARS